MNGLITTHVFAATRTIIREDYGSEIGLLAASVGGVVSEHSNRGPGVCVDLAAESAFVADVDFAHTRDDGRVGVEGLVGGNFVGEDDGLLT